MIGVDEVLTEPQHLYQSGRIQRSNMLNQTLGIQDVVDVLKDGTWQRGKICGSQRHVSRANFPEATSVVDSYEVMLIDLTRSIAKSDGEIRLISHAARNP